MAPPTSSELATLVHDLRSALGQHAVGAKEVRNAAEALLQACLPVSQRDTLAMGATPAAASRAPWRSGDASSGDTWAPQAPPSENTWAPDAVEAGTWAPGTLDGDAADEPTEKVPGLSEEPTEKVAEAPETHWEQGPGVHAPSPTPAPAHAPVDLESWCKRILDGVCTSADALEALEQWRPAEGAADRRGRYVVARELGRGGMGQVVEADDVYLRRTVAIKVLTLPSKSARKRFIEEARLTAMLSHPGVVPVHDVGETPDGKPFFAMKRIRGRSLHQVIHTGGMPALAERLDVFKRVCEAVAFAHDAGVLHLDLKPDNVMVGDYGEVLVVDWGLATEVGDGGQAVRQVAGTPAYMAPEQATAGAPLDRRADVYALGAVLFELLTDEPPIPVTTVTEMLDKVRTGEVRTPRGVRASVPRELDALVQLAMSQDPERRPDHALLLRDEVRAYQEHRELQTLQYGLWSRLSKWRQRNTALMRGIGLAGGIAVVLLAVGTVLWISSLSAALQEQERQALLAKKAQARAELNLGRSQLTLERYRVAEGVLETAAAVLHELGEPTAAVDLALAEARAAKGQRETLALPFTPDVVQTNGEVVLFHTEAGANGWLDLASGDVHDGPPGALAVRTSLGLAWWTQGDGVGTLAAFDDSWSVEVPGAGPVQVQHGIVYRRHEGLAYDLTMDSGGRVTWTRWALRPGICEGKALKLVGHHGSCQEDDSANLRTVNLRTGESWNVAPLQSDPTGQHMLHGRGLRVQVVGPDGKLIWQDDSRPHRTVAHADGIVWRDDRHRIRAASWATGKLAFLLDAAGTPEESPFDAAPAYQVVVVVDGNALHVLRPAARTLATLGNARHGSPYAIAAGPAGIAYMTDRVIHRSPQGPGPVTWSERPIEGNARGAAWASDGTLAVALRRTGVALVSPDGSIDVQPMPEGCCLDVAWRDDVLAAVGSAPELHERTRGEWTTHAVPAFSEGSWSIVPYGEGWLMSDYKDDKVHARHVVAGEVIEEYAGDTAAMAFALATDGTSVAVATGDGPWLWTGSGPGRQLDTSFGVAVGWVDTGPVAAGSDLILRFYDLDGGELHAWPVGEVVAAISSTPRGLGTASMERIRWIPLDLEALRAERP